VELLLGALDDAAVEGYTVLAVSGGEPLLYRELPRLIARARDVGMTTTVTSNGTLLDAHRLSRLEGLDLLAISLDGRPSSHDRIRGRGAFGRMERHLDAVRESGIPFGFIFTLTQHNLPELEWLVRFALDQGAALVQVHPLELAGRGSDLSRDRPDEDELQWAVVEASRLQVAVGSRLVIHVDALPAGALRLADEPPCASGPMGRLLHPLVVESDGTVVPLEHGFDRRWRLGSLYDRPLSASIDWFRRNRLADFHEQVVRRAAADAASRASRFVNWHEALSRRSAVAR
jgi:Fe-coproporphyrin III synthase